MNSRERTVVIFLIAVLAVGVTVNIVRHQREAAALGTIRIVHVTDSTETAQADTTDNSGLIDINNASATRLDLLPGIGPALAQRIVDYRKDHGPFRDIDGLLQVPGIGPKKLAAIRDHVTADGSSVEKP